MLARAALLVLLSSLAPRLVWAQASPGPALPMGMDIRKAPVGAWAEYKVTLAEFPPFKQHIALVARDAATHSLEITSEGGTMGNAPRIVLRVVLEADPAKKERVRRLVMQLGDNDPMELPQDGARQQKDQFAPLNPRKVIGSKKVQVAAGLFNTQHYRDKASGGGPPVDVWVSDLAPPLGLVRLEGSVAQGPEGKYPLTMELTARGSDAKPIVTKAPRPFDPALLRDQTNRAVGGAAKGK